MSAADPLVFSDDENFTAARLNDAMTALNLRLKAQEGLAFDYQSAVTQLVSLGLDRLNTALLPVYNKLIAIAQIGVIFSAGSATANTLGTGPKTFVIEDDRKETFAPAAYLQIQSTADTTRALYGSLQRYDATTGTLVVTIDQVRGVASGPIVSWQVSAAGTPDLISTAHDIGAYTQGEVDAAISAAVAALKNGAPANLDTLGELATAVGAIGAGAPANLATFAQVSTALDNRLRSDVAQGLNAAAISQALSNLGVSTFIKTLLGNIDGPTARGTLGVAPLASPAFTGTATFGARPTFAGQTPWDTGNFNPASYAALTGSPTFGNCTLTGVLYLGANAFLPQDGNLHLGYRNQYLSEVFSTFVTNNSAARQDIPGTFSLGGSYLDIVRGGVLRYRILVDAAGNMLHQNGDNGDNFFYLRAGDGAIWSKQLGGFLSTWVQAQDQAILASANANTESRAEAYANNALTSSNANTEARAAAYADDRLGTATARINNKTLRFVYAGDLDLNWNFNGSVAEPYSGAVVTCMRSGGWSDQETQIFTHARYRYLQMTDSNGNPYGIGY